MPALILHGLLLMSLVLHLLTPLWEDALARAIMQIYPLAGRAGSLVRPERVQVAAHAAKAREVHTRRGAAAQILSDPAASDEAFGAARYHHIKVANSAPVPDAAEAQGVAGRATFRALGSTALGKAVRPGRGQTGRSAERDTEVAVAKITTNGEAKDIEPTSMVKKTVSAGHSRPELLLLLRSSSTAPASPSHSGLQSEGTIEVVIRVEMAPEAGANIPSLTGRGAGNVTLQLDRRGAAAQRDAPCRSTTCTAAVVG